MFHNSTAGIKILIRGHANLVPKIDVSTFQHNQPGERIDIKFLGSIVPIIACSFGKFLDSFVHNLLLFSNLNTEYQVMDLLSS